MDPTYLPTYMSLLPSVIGHAAHRWQCRYNTQSSTVHATYLPIRLYYLVLSVMPHIDDNVGTTLSHRPCTLPTYLHICLYYLIQSSFPRFNLLFYWSLFQCDHTWQKFATLVTFLMSFVKTFKGSWTVFIKMLNGLRLFFVVGQILIAGNGQILSKPFGTWTYWSFVVFNKKRLPSMGIELGSLQWKGLWIGTIGRLRSPCHQSSLRNGQWLWRCL